MAFPYVYSIFILLISGRKPDCSQTPGAGQPIGSQPVCLAQVPLCASLPGGERVDLTVTIIVDIHSIAVKSSFSKIT